MPGQLKDIMVPGLGVSTLIGIWIAFSQFAVTSISSNVQDDEKQRGVHLFGHIDSTINFDVLKQDNIEWITIVAWGFQDDVNSPEVGHHHVDFMFIPRLSRKKVVLHDFPSLGSMEVALGPKWSAFTLVKNKGKAESSS